MVHDILAKEDNDTLALRVYVAGGGCSGLQYGMALDDPADGDVTFNYEGIRVVIDSESLRFIEGAEIDYVDSLMGAGTRGCRPPFLFVKQDYLHCFLHSHRARDSNPYGLLGHDALNVVCLPV